MPAYFPENNTAQWGDSAERSLQKISDLLKNGDVPIKINSVAVTGPFTVNNEVEVTNDSGNPLPVGGKKPDNTVSALSLAADSRLLTSGLSYSLVGQYTLPAGNAGTMTPNIEIGAYPFGTVFFAIVTSSTSPSTISAVTLSPGVGGVPTYFPLINGNAAAPAEYTTWNINLSTGEPNVATNIQFDGEYFFRKRTIIRDPSGWLAFRRVSSSAATTTIRLYAFSELDFGTGFPHVASISSLVYPLDNNLKVSDFQTQARLGNVGDAAPTTDEPNDKGLIPLFKRLLVRVTNIIDRLPASLGTKTSSSSFPVTLASDQPAVTVSGTVTASGSATETTLTSLNNKIPSGLAVNSNRLDVNTGLSIPAAGQTTMAGSLPVVLASDQSDIGVRGAHGAITTSSAELTTSNSVEVLAASSVSNPRRYLFLQNLSTAPIYVNFTNAATATSMRLDAGSSLSFEGNFIPNNSVNLLRSTTSNQRYFLMQA